MPTPDPTSPSSKARAEAKVLNRILRALDELDAAGRARVVAYLQSVLSEEGQ